MSTSTPSPIPQTFSRQSLGLLRQLFPPGRSISTAVGAAFATEALLISRGKPALYRTDGATMAFGLLFLLWFWVSVGWLVDRMGRAWRKAFDGRSATTRYSLWCAMGLCGSSVFLLYGISWVLFLETGRFANFETARFLFFNFDQLIPYLTQAEPSQLVSGFVLWLLAFLGWPAWIYWSSSTSHTSTPASTRWSPALWLTLTVVTWTAWKQLPAEQSVVRQSIRQHALSHGLHPTFSLYVSHLEHQRAGEIPARLDTAELTPISERATRASVGTSMPTERPAPSVIFVAVESLRHDVIYQSHQGREILPNINRLARNGHHWTRAYAQSTHSDYADICLVSSLYPLRTRRHHYYGPSDPWPRTLIYDLLEPRGYATAIISSQNEAWGGMSHFLQTPGLQHFYHPETAGGKTLLAPQDHGFAREIKLGGLVAGKFPDAHTTEVAIAWIEQQQQAGRPFFLSMNFQSSHFPYLMPDEVERPFQPAELDPKISFVNYPVSETERVRNAYFNAVHECDRQVGRLVETLHRLKLLENTILVVTGENGEAFHECGVVTHAREPVEPAIHVACVMHGPNYLPPQRDDYPFEHVDLVPTVLSLMGLPTHPNFQGIDALSTQRPAADQRLTFCHVLSSLAEADSVSLGGRWKLTEDRRSGRTTLHDVQQDPLETTDLSDEHPKLARNLFQTLRRWRDRQLAYYHYPQYYLHFYPPAAPHWIGVDHHDSDAHHDRPVSAADESNQIH